MPPGYFDPQFESPAPQKPPRFWRGHVIPRGARWVVWDGRPQAVRLAPPEQEIVRKKPEIPKPQRRFKNNNEGPSLF